MEEWGSSIGTHTSCFPRHLARSTEEQAEICEILRRVLLPTPKSSVCPVDTLVVELGGTAGEVEHSRMLHLLFGALGSPSLHVHLSLLVARCGSTSPISTKAAQISMRYLVEDMATP